MDKTPGIRPRLGVWHWLDVASRHAFPCVQTGLVMLLLSAPFGVPGQAVIQSAWLLASVFFWSLYRPASMPAFAVFLLGLMLDLLTQGPLGLAVLVLLLTHGVALKSRHWLTRYGFAVVWLVFAGLALGVAAWSFLFLCLLSWQALPVVPAMAGFGVTVGIYPFLATYFIALHRSFAAPERAA